VGQGVREKTKASEDPQVSGRGEKKKSKTEEGEAVNGRFHMSSQEKGGALLGDAYSLTEGRKGETRKKRGGTLREEVKSA